MNATKKLALFFRKTDGIYKGQGFQFFLKIIKICPIFTLMVYIKNHFYGFEDIHQHIVLAKFQEIQPYQGELIQC